MAERISHGSQVGIVVILIPGCCTRWQTLRCLAVQAIIGISHRTVETISNGELVAIAIVSVFGNHTHVITQLLYTVKLVIEIIQGVAIWLEHSYQITLGIIVIPRILASRIGLKGQLVLFIPGKSLLITHRIGHAQHVSLTVILVSIDTTHRIRHRQHIAQGIVTVCTNLILGILDTHDVTHLVVAQCGRISQSICLRDDLIIVVVSVRSGIAASIGHGQDVATHIIRISSGISCSIHHFCCCTICIIGSSRNIIIGIRSIQWPALIVISE